MSNTQILNLQKYPTIAHPTRPTSEIEVKSFIDSYQINSYREQAADYAKSLSLDRVTVALFIPVLDETVLEKLSTIQVVSGVEVNVVAIGWV